MSFLILLLIRTVGAATPTVITPLSRNDAFYDDILGNLRLRGAGNAASKESGKIVWKLVGCTSNEPLAIPPLSLYKPPSRVERQGMPSHSEHNLFLKECENAQVED
jgi:hypothetical protein